EVVLSNKPQDLIDVSSKGTVPVLGLHNGTVFDESLDIMRWALTQSDPFNWLGAESINVDALINENDGPFKYHLDRYKYAARYADAKPEQERRQAVARLEPLERRLTRHEQLLGT